MAKRLAERIGKKFHAEIRFLKGMMDKPRVVGAILPTSSFTARRMSSIINPQSPLPVLELGPGTGVITKAILERGVPPEKIISIEYSTEFYEHLVKDFPCVNFIHGDAFDIDRTLGVHKDQMFDTVISGIPMLNFPMEMRVGLIEKLLNRVSHSRPVVQFSYGPLSPIMAKPESYQIGHFDFVVRNIPPAQIWVYRRP